MAGYPTYPRPRTEIECGQYSLILGEKTLLMGILNITPDSFSDGGRYRTVEECVERCVSLEADGSDIVDIGGESTRPGAEEVSVEEEIRRTAPVIKAAVKRLRVPISIDTRKAEVAREALKAGASIVNDVTALGDDQMASVAADHDAPVVLMHMRGDPKTMQDSPEYSDVVGEIKGFLRERMEYAVASGIRRDRLIIDPGIGFGKTLDHNLEIFRRLGEFGELGAPVLVGPSRKSFIGAVSGGGVENRVFGTAAAVVASILQGAEIVRVHDVKEMRQAADIADAIVYGRMKP